MNTPRTFSLYAVKGFKGRGGQPLNQGKLKKDNKVVGTWTEDFNGGMLTANLQSNTILDDFVAWGLAFLASIPGQAPATPPTSKLEKEVLVERIIAELLEEHFVIKDAEKATKGGVLVFAVTSAPTTGAPRVSIIQYPHLRYCPEHIERGRQQLEVKPAETVKSLNEMLGQTLMTLEQAEKSLQDDWLKSLCKKGKIIMLWREPGTSVDAVKSTPGPFSLEAAKALRAKYPQIQEIVNERFAKA